MNTDLLCIVGAGHSGSTLLDLLLGRHEDIFSLGEISHFDEYHSQNRVCSCGASFDQCKFWSQIGKTWNSDLLTATSGAAFTNPGEKLQYQLSTLISLVPMPVLHKAMYRAVSPNMHQRATNVHSLYATIRKTADKSIVVDSSKYIHRFKLLHAQRPEQTRAIFLTRDGRSIVASKYKRQHTSATTSAKKWRRTNRYSRYILRNMPADAYIHIRYEELCREPEATLARICEFAGISFDKRMLSLENIEAHNIGGNRMRMNPGKDIREDRKWQSLLSENQLQQFETIAGEMNRLLLGQYHTTGSSPTITENTFTRRHSD